MDKTNALSLTGGGMFDGGWTPVWLIKDEFTDTVTAGSVNGTAATPGPGTRTVTDTDSDGVSVGSGVLAIANPNSVYGDPGVSYAQQTRATGLALIAKAQFTVSATGGVGFTAAVPNGPTSAGVDFSGGALRFFPGTVAVGSASLSQYYMFAVVLRSNGNFVFIKGGTFTSWTLLYISATGTGNLYPMIGTFSTSIDADYLRVIQLPAPFDTDDGLATDTHSGSVAAGTTFTHESDFVLEFTVDTLPSAGSVYVFFRLQDSENYWRVFINSSGGFGLHEFVNGGGTIRANVAGVVTDGYRIVVIASAQTLKGYSNNALRWTYSSATNSATATAGEVNSLGTGGAVSDVKTWPRTLSGTAAGILNKASA